ncbi:hypothetical protein D3C71_1315510 [compost metagenome]
MRGVHLLQAVVRSAVPVTRDTSLHAGHVADQCTLRSRDHCIHRIFKQHSVGAGVRHLVDAHDGLPQGQEHRLHAHGVLAHGDIANDIGRRIAALVEAAVVPARGAADDPSHHYALRDDDVRENRDTAHDVRSMARRAPRYATPLSWSWVARLAGWSRMKVGE